MTEELINCLTQERSIYRRFKSFLEIGSYEAFHSPSLEEVPHWNLVYPQSDADLRPPQMIFEKIQNHYVSLGLRGNLATTDSRFKDVASEESEYFVLDKVHSSNPPWDPTELTHAPEDLGAFCDVIKSCAGLSEQATKYFRSKMEIQSSFPDSHFYVVQHREQILGCCSTFRTSNGSDFLFNVATLASSEGKGVAKSIIAYAASQSPRPLFTYSHNEKMRSSILPSLGFRSLGTLYCVPLDLVT